MGMRGVLCFLFLSLLVLVRGLNPSLNDDVLGLIVFKSDIQDPNGKLVSWNEEDYSPCNWDGVKCNPRSNRVSELNLDDFGLSGKIGRGLLQLQFLRKLSLAKNNLTGGLSVGLTQLPNLRVMDLSQNSLSGPIPADFFQQCGSLRSISLAKNKFSGQIPESLSSCAALASLNLSSNQFSGVLPPGIWSLPSLRSLDLSDNLLKGEIPKDVEGLKNLRGINLRNNQIEGEVPDGIGDCLLLRSIDFSQNSLSGGLPSTMQKLSLCNELILKQNAFTGDFPDWIGEMHSSSLLPLTLTPSLSLFPSPLPCPNPPWKPQTLFTLTGKESSQCSSRARNQPLSSKPYSVIFPMDPKKNPTLYSKSWDLSPRLSPSSRMGCRHRIPPSPVAGTPATTRPRPAEDVTTEESVQIHGSMSLTPRKMVVHGGNMARNKSSIQNILGVTLGAPTSIAKDAKQQNRLKGYLRMSTRPCTLASTLAKILLGLQFS